MRTRHVITGRGQGKMTLLSSVLFQPHRGCATWPGSTRA